MFFIFVSVKLTPDHILIRMCVNIPHSGAGLEFDLHAAVNTASSAGQLCAKH